MHEDQLTIDAATVRALVADARPDLADEPVERVEGGTDSAIFRIGTGLAARFPLRPEDPDTAATSLHGEQQALAAFARACSVPSPLPRGVGAPGHGFPLPWSLQTWIDGRTATPHAHADSADLARDLAGLIASLRRDDTHGRRFRGPGRGGRLTDHDAWVAECLGRSAGLLDTTSLGALWERLRSLPRTDADVMSHTDLIPANLLVANGRLVGVLDTGGYRPADPALDLVAAWHLLDAPTRSVLRKTLGASDLAWLRGAAWAFEQAIGLVWYYEETHPAMADLGRTTLGRLLADDEVRAA